MRDLKAIPLRRLVLALALLPLLIVSATLSLAASDPQEEACQGTMGTLASSFRAVEEYRAQWDATQPYDVHVWRMLIPMPDVGGGVVIAYVTGAKGGAMIIWRQHPQADAQCVVGVEPLSPFEVMSFMTPEEVKEYRVGGGPTL